MMRKTQWFFCCIPALLMLFSCRPANDRTSIGETDILNGLRPAVFIDGREVTYNLTDRMKQWNVPGVSMVVIDNMQIVYAGAFGNKKMGENSPADVNTLFQAASVSKPVAAVGAMTLAYKNILELDTNVNELLKGWQLSGNGYQQEVTVRQILSHTAGLNVGGFSGYMSEDLLPELIDILEGTPPANSPPVKIVKEPGIKFRYSGGGYQVMQKIIEDVTGSRFQDVMKEHVFGPLEMANSHYAPLDSAYHGNVSFGHTLDDCIPDYAPIHAESAAGGLWTTPSDLGLLLIDLMKAYTNQESGIMDQAALRSMMKPVYWGYGLGFKVNGEGEDFRFSHGGATTGWHCNFIALPEKGQAVVVMTNGSNGWVLWPEIERSVAHLLEWPILEPKSIESIELTENQIREYTGNYAMNGLEVKIRSESSGISFEGAGLKWQLIPTKPDTLEIMDMEGQVYFRRDENNVVNEFHLWFGEPEWSPYRAWDFRKQ